MRGLRLGLSLTGGTVSPSLPASVTFTNTANTTATLQADGSYLVVKTSLDAWDGAAATAASLTGDYMMIVGTYANNKNFFFGASLTPAGTSDNTGFSRALNGNGAGTLFTINSDATTGSSNAYLANEFWSLKRVGGVHTVAHGLSEDPATHTVIGAMGLTNDVSAVGAKAALYYLNSQIKVRAYAL